jgi:hypothetical protein
MKGVIIYEAAKEPHVRRNNSRLQMSIGAAGAAGAAAGAPPSLPRTSWEKWIAGECAHRTPTERKPNAKGEANTSAGYSWLRKLRNRPLWDSNGRISIPRFYSTITVPGSLWG